MYDVAVVGAGLIGAAAAKYLAKKGLKVEAGLSKSQWFIGKKENTGFRNSRVGKLPILNKLASLYSFAVWEFDTKANGQLGKPRP